MNYLKHYVNLIHKAQNRSKPEGYTEKHHIIPKSCNGSNNKNNLAILTAREHYIAHLLLAKIYGGSMIYAIYRMTPHKRRNSRLYKKFKEEWKIWFSNNFSGVNNHMYGRKHTDETILKFREYYKTHDHVMKGKKGKKLSEEAKKKISIFNLNRGGNPYNQIRSVVKNKDLFKKIAELVDIGLSNLEISRKLNIEINTKIFYMRDRIRREKIFKLIDILESNKYRITKDSSLKYILNIIREYIKDYNG